MSLDPIKDALVTVSLILATVALAVTDHEDFAVCTTIALLILLTTKTPEPK